MRITAALLLGLILVFTLAACSGSGTKPSNTPTVAPDSEVADHIAYITLGDTITIDGEGAIVEGSVVSITSSGTYYISGTLKDGQIRVYTADSGTVKLVLNGTDITSSASAPIYIINAEKTVINLADGTDNFITDGTSYTFENAESDEPDAAIFSNDDLAINGNGSLTVNANYNDGIKSHDDLKVTGGVITINAADDGIIGRDSLTVKDGDITINSGGDGIKASNDEDETKGYIVIEDGTIDITAGTDGIQSETNITIAGGDITISSGDDGVHADSSIEINGGEISITKSYEGIESTVITINGGIIHINSSDDGINAANKLTDSTDNRQRYSADAQLCINGGYIAVDARDDGIDVNGPVDMTGGFIIINHYRSLPFDYVCGGQCNFTGGLIITIRNADYAFIKIAQNISSDMLSVLLHYESQQPPGTMIHIESESGQNILTFAPTEAYSSVLLCSPELDMGTDYVVYSGGSSIGIITDGLYSGGVYIDGTQVANFSISSSVTRVIID